MSVGGERRWSFFDFCEGIAGSAGRVFRIIQDLLALAPSDKTLDKNSASRRDSGFIKREQ